MFPCFFSTMSPRSNPSQATQRKPRIEKCFYLIRGQRYEVLFGKTSLRYEFVKYFIQKSEVQKKLFRIKGQGLMVCLNLDVNV